MKITGATALTESEIDDLMTHAWIIRLGTAGPDGRINVAPLWYCWAERKVYAYTRGRKIFNLRHNPNCTVLVDQNHRYPELKGVMFEGQARVLESVGDEKADEVLETVVRDRMGVKYREGGFGTSPSTRNDSTAMGSDWRWVVVTPERGFSWDNAKARRR